MKILLTVFGVLSAGVLLLCCCSLIVREQKRIQPLDITRETSESIARRIVVGKTTQADVLKIMGDPGSRTLGTVGCDPAEFPSKPYLCDPRWSYERRTNFLVSASLDVYFNAQGIVSGTDLKDNH